MVDGAASLMSVFNGLRAAGGWSEQRGSNLLDGGAPFYGVYETADGRHVALGPLEPKFFAEFARRVGLPERYVRGQHDRSLWPEMRAAIAGIVRTRTRDQWSAQLEGTDACFAPVLSLDEAPSHPHALARASYVKVDGLTQPAPAPRFDRSVPDTPRPAPTTGAHTTEVLIEAGFDAAQLDALRAAGVIG
jgi:alpha-methylacyl-CoA racemase